MSDITCGIDADKRAASKYYIIAWRWHFYAGLYVVPFLLILAVTGLTMLWISWGAGLGAERMSVAPRNSHTDISTLQRAAEAAVPGGWTKQYVEPLASDRVAVVSVENEVGITGVALDPYTGGVLHTFPWRAGWYDFANDIHGTLLLGAVGDRMIEVAASLALLLIATGLYLNWPRNGARWQDVLTVRRGARGRSFWKSVHGAVGTWISLVLILFLLSGLSWSGIWGERIVQAWNTFPTEKWAAPLSDDTHANMNHENAHEVPWALEKAPLPVSGSLSGADAIEGAVTIDSVAKFARGLGFIGRFQVNFPQDDSGVWTISHDSMSNDGPNPAADRTIHIDQYSGKILADVRYSDYSAYAKAMAWGIAFHEGDLGVWNLVLNTAFCLAIVVITLSGLVLWWKRRPSRAGRLSAPPRPRDAPLWKGAAALVIILGLIFPMAGISIAIVLMLDMTVMRSLPPLKRALS